MEPLNLARLQEFIDMKRINPDEKITMYELYWSGCVHGIKHGIKLLGDVSFVV